ncbi:MAG: urea ABC transporter permease subunit UrtB, partial [Azoarcus sp.]|nr:urea ABC transporter permease subunit UrtB [Azoarcus sp.]
MNPKETLWASMELLGKTSGNLWKKAKSAIRLRLLATLCLASSILPAQAALPPEALAGFAGDFPRRIAAIEALGVEGGLDARRVLEALEAGRLGLSGERVLIVEGGVVFEAASGEALPGVEAASVETITVNNRVRRALANARAALALAVDDEAAARREAAITLSESASPAWLPLFERALVQERDETVRAVLARAAARVRLADADAAMRRQAARDLRGAPEAAVRNLLAGLLAKTGEGATAVWAEPDAGVREAAAESLRAIDRRIALAQTAGTVFTGLSLGSILLLAALGLAITYGVMGVINMAHGELLMVGAYATFVVQGVFRRYFPEWIDAYIVAAIPVAFLAAALTGALMERCVLRYLYGRPLESLLATWGLSLILIQSARVAFGPQNLELANPSWMSGGLELAAGVALPFNRIAIIVFAAFVLLLIW